MIIKIAVCKEELEEMGLTREELEWRIKECLRDWEDYCDDPISVEEG